MQLLLPSMRWAAAAAAAAALQLDSMLQRSFLTLPVLMLPLQHCH
jgi:hypothetical protein